MCLGRPRERDRNRETERETEGQTDTQAEQERQRDRWRDGDGDPAEAFLLLEEKLQTLPGALKRRPAPTWTVDRSCNPY